MTAERAQSADIGPDNVGSYDVAVVGLGPVGFTLVHLLAGEGLRVVGIERAVEVHPLPRAIGLDHEAMRIFQRIGIADALLPHTGAYRDTEYRAADDTVLRRIVQASGPNPLAWPPNLTFVQPELDRILLETARALPTVRLELGKTIVGLEQTGDAVEISLAANTDVPQSRHRARYVVGCDGANSWVRQHLGIGLEDLNFDEPWIVVDVVLIPGVELPEVNVQRCDPARPMTYVRTPGNIRRWEIMLLPGETVSAMTHPDQIWRFLRPWLSPDQNTIWRAAAYRFHALVAERWRAGRIFLAGDACHQTPPFLAQGLNQGLRDAANLAWKLAAVQRDEAHPALLETYEQERRPNVRKVIEITKALGRTIGERDPVKAQERDVAMAAEMVAGRGTVVRQHLLPPLAHGLIDSTGSMGAGEPAPQPWIVTSNGDHRLDDLTSRGWRVLITPRCHVTPPLRAAVEAIRAELVCLARVAADPGDVVERDGVVHEWLDQRAAVAVVVRPDGVAYGTAADADALMVSLDQVAARLKGSLPIT